MALPLSRPLNGTWNVDGSRSRESSRKIQTFISKLSLLSPDDKPKVWPDWIEIHFDFSNLSILKKDDPCQKLHIFFGVQFASGERILGEEFLGKSTHLAAAGSRSARHCRLLPTERERTKAFFFTLLNFFPAAATLVAVVWLLSCPLRTGLGWRVLDFGRTFWNKCHCWQESSHIFWGVGQPPVSAGFY